MLFLIFIGVLFLIGYFLLYMMDKAKGLKNDLICTHCGNIGRPMTVTKGSITVEVFLWCLMIVPGVLYSVWRLSSQYKGCVHCNASSLIPVNSPNGKKLIEERNSQKSARIANPKKLVNQAIIPSKIIKKKLNQPRVENIYKIDP